MNNKLENKAKKIIEIYLEHQDSDDLKVVQRYEDFFEMLRTIKPENFCGIDQINLNINYEFALYDSINNTLTSMTNMDIIKEIQTDIVWSMEELSLHEQADLSDKTPEAFVQDLNIMDLLYNYLSYDQLAQVGALLLERQDYFNRAIKQDNGKYLVVIAGKYDEPTIIDKKELVNDLMDYYATDKKALFEELESEEKLILNIIKGE